AEVISDVLDEKERLGCSLDNKRTIQKRLEGFRDTIINYPVNIYSVPEKALQYDKSKDNFLEILENISEMFVRLNTTGTRIKLSDLVAAILTAKARERIGVSFRNRIMEIVDQFDKKGWDIDEPILTRTYMVIATNKTNFKEAKEDLENLASKAIIENLEKVSDALNRLISLLDRELNIKSDKYLKSKYSLVTLAYYEYKRGPLRPEDVKAMKRWLVLSSFSKRYTGRLESDLREDIAKIRDGKSFKDIEDFLTVKSIGKNLFDNSYDKEHLLTLLILLKDAYDLRTDALSRIGELKSSELNVHHIFPIEVLKKVYGEEIKIGETKMDIETAADLAANITIISKTANQQIEDKRPDEYLRNYSEEYLKTHCIPLDQELWKPKNYARFLEMRQKNLVEKINKIILHS
ncbi:MAG: DUF1524 domain-containing protein, partial [Candidatus Methanomethyliales bacterium]|nr:DUF1524 domain-containing protein [Candidatus Methanomethylicales archaeon]